MSDERESDGRASDRDEQRHRLTEAFGDGWVTPAHGPVIFDEEQLARIEPVRDHGGWLYRQESEYLQRL